MAKDSGLVGIDTNFIADAIIGAIISIGIIFLSKVIPSFGVIGIPSIPASLAGDIGRILIIIVAAPIFEEIFFRDFVLDFFDNKLADLPFIVAAVISSILFSLFHFWAYGESLRALSGSFFGAALIGLMFCYIRKYTNSNMGNIFAHAILNGWIMSKLFIVGL